MDVRGRGHATAAAARDGYIRPAGGRWPGNAGLQRQQISCPSITALSTCWKRTMFPQAIELMKRHILDWEPVFVSAIIDID